TRSGGLAKNFSALSRFLGAYHIVMTEEPQTTNGQQEQGGSPIPALRTFRSDAERYVKEKGITLSEITAKEVVSGHLRYAEDGSERMRFTKRMILLAALALVLLLSSTALMVRLFRGDGNGAPVLVSRPEAIPLVTPEQTVPLVMPEGDRGALLGSFQEKIKQPLPENRLVFFPVFEQTGGGAERLVSAQRFFAILGITPPSDIERALGNAFQWSVLPAQGINHLLLVFSSTQPSRALAGMLRWELTLMRDLRPLYSSRVNTDTGLGAFTDTVMDNNDVRVLRNNKGTPVLLYTFFNKNLLLIASSAETLERAIGRIAGIAPI
ncbi:MAG: hypothetical protein HYS74_02855, partial [Parcubacteria group bacterium]|nr:hypothetical protein [Parcubacteria group bacterium]